MSISFDERLRMIEDVIFAGLRVIFGFQNFQRSTSIGMIARVSAVSIVLCQPGCRYCLAAEFINNRVRGAIESISDVKKTKPVGTIPINMFKQL